MVSKQPKNYIKRLLIVQTKEAALINMDCFCLPTLIGNMTMKSF